MTNQPVTRRQALKTFAGTSALLAGAAPLAGALAAVAGGGSPRPNILWLIADDMCPNAACDGQPVVRTPHIDRLAREGQRFAQTFSCAAVCSPGRSALITGMYATTTGCHNHRSNREGSFTLPAPVRTLPEIFREAGYFTANVKHAAPGCVATQKTDYNFPSQQIWGADDWSQRRKDQPFFAQITFLPPHRGPAWLNARKQSYLVDSTKIAVPPCYPDAPITRNDLANYLDCVDLVDTHLGQVLKRLDDDGLTDNTLLIFTADHGRPMVRGKQFLYDEGTQIPLIVRWPGKLKPGVVRDDLISNIDISAASLAAAGVPVPGYMQGRDFLQAHPEGRAQAFSARDRCDETIDRIRSVRSRQYRYIRNFMPDRPWTQPNKYKEEYYPVLAQMKKMHAEGTLTPEADTFMGDKRPVEELYDLAKDPDQVHNVASRPEYQAPLVEHRRLLDEWMVQTKDRGGIPETDTSPAPGPVEAS